MIRPNVIMQIPSKSITGQPIRSLRAPLPCLLLSVAVGAILAGWTTAAEDAKPTQPKDGPPAEAGATEAAKDQVAPPPLPPDPNDTLLVPDLSALPTPEKPRYRATPQRQDSGEFTADGEMTEREEVTKPFTYTLPGFYGSGPVMMTSGMGALAGPRFRATISLGAGYDDNIRSGSNGAANEKVASAFTNLRLDASYHTAALAQVFTFNAGAGVDVFWSDADPDYQGSLAMTYQRSFVGPYSVSANVALSYQSQPNYGAVNFARTTARQGEEEGDGGNLTASAKVDFSYHWSPQISTVTSIAADTRLYGSDSEGDETHLTLGNELRYRVDRYTWIGEVRYETISAGSGGQENSGSLYLLGGVEWHLGPWIRLSARGGESIRSYENGGSKASPHGEFSINFAPDIQNTFSLTSRYGLETSPDAQGDSTTFRVGLSYTRVFTTRLNGVISASYVTSKENSASRAEDTTTRDGVDDERIIDVTASLNYQLSSRISLSGSITCTRGSSPGGTADPDRNRVMVNASYAF
jgi:hypothetical protein